MNRALDTLALYGFGMEGATRVMSGDMARDADLVTAPNAGVPSELTTFFNPKVVEVLRAPLRARAIFPEEKNGDAASTSAKFQMLEYVGHTEPYDDYADGGTADINANWVTRDPYLFQTIRRYGNLEEMRNAAAKLSLAAATQRSAAVIIDTDYNRFAFLGVAGLRNYGILNDPGLNATITPAATGTSSGTKWETKTTKLIFDDILSLFQQRVLQTAGKVSKDDKLIFAMSPETAVRLASATDFNVSVTKMMDGYFRNYTIVTAPEYATTGGELVQCIAVEIDGQETGVIGFNEKFFAFAPVRKTSSIVQKFRAGTYGAIIKAPAGVAGMLGV